MITEILTLIYLKVDLRGKVVGSKQRHGNRRFIEVHAHLFLDAGLVADELPRGHPADRHLALPRSEILDGETGDIARQIFKRDRAGPPEKAETPPAYPAVMQNRRMMFIGLIWAALAPLILVALIIALAWRLRRARARAERSPMGDGGGTAAGGGSVVVGSRRIHRRVHR